MVAALVIIGRSHYIGPFLAAYQQEYFERNKKPYLHTSWATFLHRQLAVGIIVNIKWLV